MEEVLNFIESFFTQIEEMHNIIVNDIEKDTITEYVDDKTVKYIVVIDGLKYGELKIENLDNGYLKLNSLIQNIPTQYTSKDPFNFAKNIFSQFETNIKPNLIIKHHWSLDELLQNIKNTKAVKALERFGQNKKNGENMEDIE